MANHRDPVNLRRRGVSPHLASSLPRILSTSFVTSPARSANPLSISC